jgi:multiple sugar transport system permease protein
VNNGAKTKAEKRGVLREMRRAWPSYLLTAPFLLIFTVFTIVPVLASVFLSFTSFNILEPPKLLGPANYFTIFFDDDVFAKALGNTLLLSLFIGPGGYLLNLVFAWLINDLRPRVRAVITLIFYAPSISGNVYLIWTVLFSGDSYGYINGILLRLGLIAQPVQWLRDPAYTMGIVIIVALWSSLGTSFLAFIAGLQGIDRSYYEAAAMDGVRNRWQELWFVTLPLMKPQLMFGAVMSITASFGVGEICTALAGFPSVDYSVFTLMNHLQDYGGMRFEMGYASAIATVLFGLMAGINLLIKRLLRMVGT